MKESNPDILVGFEKDSESGLYVTADGKRICSYNKKLNTLTERPIAENTYGNSIFWRGYSWEVDEIVLRAYKGKPAHPSMKAYHINGDSHDNSANNLRWRTLFYTDEACAEIKQMDQRLGIDMDDKGVVTQHGKVCGRIICRREMVDKTMALPEVCLKYSNSCGLVPDREKADLDTLELAVMQKSLAQVFGLIDGNPEDFYNPVVLHFDGNVLNFAKGNLVWVDESDKRYQELLTAWIRQSNKYRWRLTARNPYYII